jgi:hypothetical protein
MNNIQKKIQEELAKLSNSKFANLTDNQLSDIENRYGKERPEHSEKLKGRKREDQSVRMSGDNNIMAGKVSPNRGKKMPEISAKIKGKAKPEGFGDKIKRTYFSGSHCHFYIGVCRNHDKLYVFGKFRHSFE